MDRQVYLRLALFWASLLLAIIMLWTGIQLLFLTGRMHPGGIFLLGILSVLCGIYGVANSRTVAVEASVMMITIGFYFLAATSGIIRGTWLSRLLGLASFIAAGTILYMTLPRDKT
jgi:hypothetical protein